MQANERVLLIDVENALGGLSVLPVLFQARVAAIRDAAGQLHHSVAAFGLTDADDRTPLSVLAETGIAPWPVTPGRHAAETALLEHARYVYRRGGRVFAVASGDHRFERLAGLGRLEVIAWKRQAISRRLEEAAHVVRRIPKPTRAAVSRRG